MEDNDTAGTAAGSWKRGNPVWLGSTQTEKKKGKKTLNVSSVQCLSLGFSQLPLLDVELDSTLSVQHVVRCNAQAPLPV